ncbi:DNA primase [uncultured Paludibaculum sp.]|uniref:DNA primase n=1 Tax=uncultured Paludibaculum sp. TaxID=1765020 RepID=UPI002AAA7E5F|nr:DNA primase [uncultured Paludibaculum sp.]
MNKELVDQVKSAVDIVQVVREYVPSLKRSGAGTRYVGLCPFHTEKTPSFSVHGTHQFYKCFGCGAGGDVFKFVQEMERLTFWEALKYLAERNGIPLPKRTDLADEEAKKRGAVYEMNEIAVKVYRDLLFSPAGQEARAYLKHRGLSQAIAEEFSLGLSERGGQMLVRIFEKQGFSHAEMESSGLVRLRNEGTGHYDVFRGRLMFPIHSETGKVIGFGARALAEGDEPKYLNSGDSDVYQKRSVLYNLNRARKPIQEAGFSVLVEGYMDVIGVYASGVRNVVASCGTALTNFQVRSLRRHAGEVVLNFDPDNAGANAAEKSIPILLEESVRLRVLSLTDGLDPDEYIKANGPSAYMEALRNARGYFHWLADRARTRFDLHTPEGRVAAFQFLLPAIQKMPDKLDRLAVANDVAEYLKMEPGIVLDEFRKAAAEKRGRVTRREENTPDANEVLLLHALLGNAEAREQIAPVLRGLAVVAKFRSARIFETILQLIAEGANPSYSSVEPRLSEPDKALLVSLVFADDTLSQNFTTEQAVACVKQLALGERDVHLADLRGRIKDAERSGNMEEALQLMEELNGLKRS